MGHLNLRKISKLTLVSHEIYLPANAFSGPPMRAPNLNRGYLINTPTNKYKVDLDRVY